MSSPNLIITANPDFKELALAEVQQNQPRTQILGEVEPGVWLCESPASFLTFAERWQKNPPIFVRHLCPVQVVVPLKGSSTDVAALQTAVTREFLDLFEAELPFAVQTRLAEGLPYRKFDVNAALSDIIQQKTGAVLNTKRPLQILSVVVGEGNAYLGVSLASQNLSNWAGGVHRFARDEGQISRAEFKLLEALAVFEIALPARGTALDLGAAPGGWTRILRQKEQYVTAVDPAELAPALRRDSGVRRIGQTAEAYLADDPDPFDLIVNDMRMDGRDSARLMVAYAKCLYPGGAVIMTCKLPEEGRTAVIDHSFNILRTSYQIAGARQLFHNRSEITLYLKLSPQTFPAQEGH